MSRTLRRFALAFLGLLAMASPAAAQPRAYVGYVYPAGGQQGTTFEVKLGGQGLDGLDQVLITGSGVTAKVSDYCRRLGAQETSLMREQLAVLKKAGDQPDAAAQKIIERIEKRFAENVTTPACASLSSLAFVEVTIAPDAEPGPREIRLASPRAVSNPLPFYVGQLPEFSRKPMITATIQVLGKEELALRKRPEEEAEQRITVPCTINGQIASGEINWHRFEARKGQRLVFATRARQLVPYIADAVPGWFQAVLTLYDAEGKEVAYDDDYRFKPDPVLYYEVPKDGEYVLAVSDALYRGREDFVYRTTIGEVPFVTSIFPLGGRVGEPVKIEMKGWNLEGAELKPPAEDAAAGVYHLTARKSGMVSNRVPFALDTLPECLDKEPNNDVAAAQKVELPVIVNGRIDRPDDWDVFKVTGRAGEKLVAEVTARRLDSPLDSVLKVTDAGGKLLALNDDCEDAGSGLNTHHADSYLIVDLPADGDYFVHIGDVARSGGEAYAYRLRISPPQPDFALRAAPSSMVMRSKSAATVSVYAIRKDGFAGDITLGLKDAPEGFTASAAKLPAGQDMARVVVRSDLPDTKQPVELRIEGRATVGDQEIAHEAVPAEDRMQAFLWRHLVPAESLVALVYDPAYEPPPVRVLPESAVEPKPEIDPNDPAAKPKFTKQQVAGRLRQLKMLYEDWLLTDKFYAEKVAECEAVLAE